MADIFISYSRRDKNIVDKFGRWLLDAGYSVWWDRRIVAGEKWASRTEQELLRANCVIVFWTKNSIYSEFVRDEASHGLGANNLLQIVYRVNQAPIGFRQRQFIELRYIHNGVPDNPKELLDSISYFASPEIKRILIIEDNLDFAKQLGALLQENGYIFKISGSGNEGTRLGNEKLFDAVILDLELPDMFGLDILDSWRKNDNNIPVLILSARGEVSDRILGLETGAEDYLGKPCEPKELLARIKVLISRRERFPHRERGSVLVCGPLRLETMSKTLTCAGSNVNLKAKEYKLIEFLMRNQGRVVKREQILQSISEIFELTNEKQVDRYISNIRRKLNINIIHTVRGAGYFMDDANR